MTYFDLVSAFVGVAVGVFIWRKGVQHGREQQARITRKHRQERWR